MRNLIAYVSGNINVAGYRSKVATIAKALDLVGYVRYLPDGRVKIIAEGSEADLERFLKVIKIESPTIKVDGIEAEFSDATNGYEGFLEMESEWEIDAKCSIAASPFEELIAVIRYGLKETNDRLGSIDSKLGIIAAKQQEMIEKIDEAHGDVVSEVEGLRSDLKGRMEDRLLRIENDVVEIKARMKL